MFKNVKTVRVIFIGNGVDYARTQKTYVYLTDDATIKEDDIVVVDSHGYCLCKVMEVLEYETNKASKWIVQKIDSVAYKARQEKMAEMLRIEKALEAEVERARKMIDYKKLAAEHTEIAELLAKLEEIKNS